MCGCQGVATRDVTARGGCAPPPCCQGLTETILAMAKTHFGCQDDYCFNHAHEKMNKGSFQYDLTMIIIDEGTP